MQTTVPEAAPASDRLSEDGAAVQRPVTLLTTGEMARMSNNTLRTVRFYEEEGILRPARRTDGGHRLFDPSELDRLILVSDMRLAGLSLDDIKKILEVKRAATSGEGASQAATQILDRRIDELKDKVAVLERLRDDLVETRQLVTNCQSCHDEKFPDHCDSCNVMTSPATLPRGARVLWSVGGAARPIGPRLAGSGEDENQGT